MKIINQCIRFNVEMTFQELRDIQACILMADNDNNYCNSEQKQRLLDMTAAIELEIKYIRS